MVPHKLSYYYYYYYYYLLICDSKQLHSMQTYHCSN